MGHKGDHAKIFASSEIVSPKFVTPRIPILYYIYYTQGTELTVHKKLTNVDAYECLGCFFCVLIHTISSFSRFHDRRDASLANKTKINILFYHSKRDQHLPQHE